MYLSRVELDPTRRSTMAALAAPQKLHGAVESAFFRERRRRLWRLDRLGENGCICCSSARMRRSCPAWWSSLAPERLRRPGITTRFWQRVTPGSRWQFRLTANPTKKLQRRPKTRSAGNCGRTLHDTVPEAVAVGPRRKARLCPAGGGIYRDPGAVAALLPSTAPAR